MADYKGMPLAGQIQLLIETHGDFPKRLKERLVFDLIKVENHFQLIRGLLSRGVLCDGAADSGEILGLTEPIVQFALKIACCKDAGTIGSLIEALQESGNLRLLAALRTWIREEFSVELNDSNLVGPKGNDSDLQIPDFEVLGLQSIHTNEIRTSGAKLIDRIMSNKKEDFIGQLEGHWVGMASKIVNVPEFCSKLVELNVLEKRGRDFQGRKWAEKAIKAACSQRAIGSLVLAFQSSNNERILEETLEWLETAQARRNNNQPATVKSLADPGTHEVIKVVPSRYCIQKVATFSCHTESCRGPFALELSQEKLIAYLAGGTVKRWKWLNDNEKTSELPVNNAQDITWFQYDSEILIVGTANGTVHLYGTKEPKEKCVVQLDGPVRSLQFVESVLLVVARGASGDQFWWVDILRSDMRLRNARLVRRLASKCEDSGFLMERDRSFLFNGDYATVHYTESRDSFGDCRRDACWLKAPADIVTLSAVGLHPTKSYVAAGCKNGMIALWGTCKFGDEQQPLISFPGHTEAVVSVCAVGEHLLSLDKTGKLFMWAFNWAHGDVGWPVLRVFAGNLSNVTSMVSHERLLASSSSDDGTVTIWSLSDL